MPVKLYPTMREEVAKCGLPLETSYSYASHWLSFIRLMKMMTNSSLKLPLFRIRE